jgi:hypothetical protein
MKSSLHSLIPFFPFFYKCQFRRLDSAQFLCSQAHIPAAGVSKLDSVQLLCSQAHTLPAGVSNSTQFNSSAPKLLSRQPGVSKLDSIQFLCSQAHIPAGRCLQTGLSSIPLFPSSYPGRLASRNSTQFNSSAPKLISRQADVSKLDSVQFLCSQAHTPAGWCLGTLVIILNWILPYKILHERRRKHRLSILGKVCLLCHCIATKLIRLLLAAAGMCLPSHYLAMNVCSDFTI